MRLSLDMSPTTQSWRRTACSASTSARPNDAPPARIDHGRLQVELTAVKILVDQRSKVDAHGQHEILFHWTNAVAIALHIVEAVQCVPQAFRGPFDGGPH